MRKNPPKKQPNPASCRVVGIGASAGGLEAFSALLDALDADTGLAFVLVQHLDPAHESALAELLRLRTKMPVLQVKNGTQVQPNHVYVIPPNTKLSIDAGRLETVPRGSKGERYLPIDFFLNSLARDQKSNAFGVILSGTASDGTLGLKAIKEEGGITFAQDDRSARFSSMPRSAIAVGAVDFIMPPEKIAGELASIARHANGDLAHGGMDQPLLVDDGLELQHVLAMLRDHAGVDFTHYKPATIKRRMARRMVLRRTEPLTEYLRLLQSDPGELEALFNDLLINVTEFFRDPETFEFLKKVIIPKLIRDRGAGRDALRVWVPACSTGEEVYSLAICLLESIEEAQLSIPIQIFGTDVSASAIDRARQGIYTETVVSVISPERLRRFFIKLESGFQIQPSVRECCLFSRHNITRDPPLSRMDLISCRNLLIYLGPVLQKRVVVMFHYAIRATGCLLLGNSETPGGLSVYFETPDKSHRVYCRREGSGAVPDLLRGAASWPGRADLDWGETPRIPLDQSWPAPQREADRVLLTRYAPAGFLVDEKLRIVEFRGQIAAFLGPAPGEASFDLLRMLRDDMTSDVRLALETAQRTNTTVRKENWQIPYDSDLKTVHLAVIPLLAEAGNRHFLVLFETSLSPASAREERAAPGVIRKLRGAKNRTVALLEEDLIKTRQYLQSIIEELRSANEEIQSSNEELQSTNEELQTAKEELQSTNEELTTINEEMQSRNAELGQTNNDLVNLLSSIDMPIVMLGRDLRIRRFTAPSGNVFHLIPTDVGRPLLDINPQFDLPNLRDLLQGVMRTLAVAEREIRDRQGKWYLMRIRPYRTTDDEIDGAVLQMLDIDALKRSLEEAKAARLYAEAIVNTVREPLVVLDSEMRVQRANRAFYQTFELTAEAMENQPLPERAGNFWDNPRLRTLLDKASSAGNQSHELELEHDFPRVGRRTVVLTVRGIQQDHSTHMVLLAIEDVTERKQAAEARYRRLFEAAQDGIVIVSTEDREVTDANPYILDLFGHRREEWVGKTFEEIEPFRNSPEFLGAFETVLEQGVVRYDDVALLSAQGRTSRTEVVANVYQEGLRQVIQYNIRDVTERRSMEEQMRQTAKLESLGLLAGGVAHDFNNLLTGIMGNASLAVSDVRPGSQTQRLLEEVIRASERAADLTRQMLAYAGKGRFVIKAVNLSHVIRDITPLIQTSIPRKVQLELDLAENLPPVDADPGQMQQIVMNLVINGAEAVKEGATGLVTITTKRTDYDAAALREQFAGQHLSPGAYVCLQVKDSGRGMDPATQSKIFDPFFTTKFTGRGLGLAAVQGIVRGHRGGILVTSAPGAGTTFRVIFPAGKARPTEAPPGRKRKNLIGKGTVLVVDDEAIVRDLAKETLERFGYKVLTAENGEAAVKVFRENAERVSAVVLDMTMPVMAGPEAFEAMKEIRNDVLVILSSGYDEGEAVGQFERKGLAGFIQKPYAPQELAEKVKSVIQGKA